MKLNPKYGVAIKKVPHFIKLNFKFFPSHKGKNYGALNLRGKKSVMIIPKLLLQSFNIRQCFQLQSNTTTAFP